MALFHLERKMKKKRKRFRAFVAAIALQVKKKAL